MKIKLDEDLPERLVAELTALGHDVDTVRLEHLTGRIDGHVWSATQAADRFLITQDLDFSDLRRYAPGTHAGCAHRPHADQQRRDVTSITTATQIGEDVSYLLAA